jgi:multimeric flavodoxin WrbA
MTTVVYHSSGDIEQPQAEKEPLVKEMKALAINGSPRVAWNTSNLLQHALRGCEASAAETELVHLYEHDYQGCQSCFACKRIGGASYGRCAAGDGLMPILERAAEADVLLLGSPFYFHTESGEMRSFMERLLFPYLTYTPEHASIYPRRIQTALIYTMNVTEDLLAAFHQDSSIEASQRIMARIFGSCEVLLAFDTYQFDDYSKYVSTAWDPVVKARRRDEVFPVDCRKAYEMGLRLAAAAADGAA